MFDEESFKESRRHRGSRTRSALTECQLGWSEGDSNAVRHGGSRDKKGKGTTEVDIAAVELEICTRAELISWNRLIVGDRSALWRNKAC